VAVFSACNMGKRRFAAIAVAGGREETSDPLVMPCGVCRQVLAEFCSPELPIYVKGATGEPNRLLLRELLPYSFSLSEES
jgi:cytidine deaminase